MPASPTSTKSGASPDHYIISVEYIPPIDGADVTGRLGQVSNIDNNSKADLEKDINRRKFRRALLQFTLKPIKRNSEAAVNIRAGNSGKSLLLPPLIVPNRPHIKKYFWKEVRVDDRAAQDLECRGALPDPKPAGENCTPGRVGLASICWKGGVNRMWPFAACQGQADWCTYKHVTPDACRNGGNPGTMWVCVYE